MSAPKRFENGVTNVSSVDPFAMLGMPSPIKYHTYFDDFDRYDANQWVVTETQAGATQALDDGDGGVMLLTNTAADNDVVQLQSLKENFKLESGKKTWFAVRFKCADVDQTDLIAGLWIKDTSPVATPPSDGLWFISDDGDALVDIVSSKDSVTASQTAITTLADDTYISLAWYFDGGQTVKCYANGSFVADLTVSSTTLCTDEELAVSFAVQNGEADVVTMTVDYILCVKER